MAVRESVHRIERALYNLELRVARRPHRHQPGPGRSAQGRRRLSICRSRSACWSPPGNCFPNNCTTARPSANWPSTAAVRPVKGVLSMAMAARERGFKRMLVPVENAREAAVVEEIAVYGVGTLERRGRPAVGPAAARTEPQRHRRMSPIGSTNTKSISPTCAARSSPSGPWSSRPPAVITCCSSAARAPARRCWLAGCRRSCRR